MRLATHSRTVRPTSPRTWAPVALVASASLALTLLLRFRTARLLPGTSGFAAPGDHHMYIFMARHGAFGLHVAPFGWRVLVPLVVWLLPFGVTTGFEVVTFVSIWLSGVVVYLLARRFGFSRTLSFTGTVLFLSLGWAVKFNFIDFWLTDPTAFLFAVLAVYFLVTGRDVAFAVALAVGVMAKESVIFVAPLYYSFRARRLVDGRALRRMVELCLPAVAVLIGVRLLIPSYNGRPGYIATLPRPMRQNAGLIPSYTLSASFHYAMSGRSHHILQSLYKPFTAFGLLVGVLPFVAGRRNVPPFLRFLPFIVLAYAQLLFTLNTERLVVLAFPAVILLALNGAKRVAREWGAGEAWLAALAAAFLVLQLLDPNRREPQAVVQLGLLAGFAVLLAVRWSMLREAARQSRREEARRSRHEASDQSQ